MVNQSQVTEQSCKDSENFQLAVPILWSDQREYCALLSLCFPGGRGKDGAPIITFPEYSAFSEVPDEDFLSVVTYLTSIPRQDTLLRPPTSAFEFTRLIDNRWLSPSLYSPPSSLDAASIGFVIIIDRRKDKWSSVKASLSRIAVSSTRQIKSR